jgi:transcriptional regulator with XRE-family HTH domain
MGERGDMDIGQSGENYKSPNPVDIHVGKRIRARRKEVRVSQERLAEQLGLTFQQVQKYEKGANRVSASKLYEIARALQASIEYFYRGLADPSVELVGVSEADGQPFVHDFITTAEGRELVGEFTKIQDPLVRRQVLDLIKSFARNQGAPV